jgi:hypothetical protein
LGKPKYSGSFEHELFHHCAAADESTGDWFRWDASAATATTATTVHWAEEWVGQVSEFDLMTRH